MGLSPGVCNGQQRSKAKQDSKTFKIMLNNIVFLISQAKGIVLNQELDSKIWMGYCKNAFLTRLPISIN